MGAGNDIGADGSAPPSDQAAHWNGAGGRAWVEAQPVLDRMFAGFEQVLVDAVTTVSAQHVLDVGCGTGATTLAIRRSLGSAGRCVGVDLSESMIECARARATRTGVGDVEFLVGDAQTHAFAPAQFDAIVSRFGVMFFADPVTAFANLRTAAAPDAALRCIVWRGAEENPFMTAAERAVAPLVPALPPRQAGAPGQFAFADPAYVSEVLQAGGWHAVELQPVDIGCELAASELRAYVTRIGPLGRLLPTLDAVMQARVIEAVLPAFDAFLRGDQVRFDAACWMVRARAARRGAEANRPDHG